MAKRDNQDFEFTDNELEAQIVQEEENRIILATSNDVAKFERYSNLFDHPNIKDIIPDFYTGESLIGHVIAIHNYEWKESYAHKVQFVVADIEIAGYDGMSRAGFFSVAAKTVFKGLDNAKVQLPIVVGVKQQKNTYIFCNPTELLRK